MSKVQFLHLLIEHSPGRVVRKVVFSPEAPRFCVVLFEEGPPDMHDMRQIALFNAVERVRHGQSPDDVVVLDGDTLVRFANINANPVDVACRPGSTDLALAFGEDTGIIYLLDYDSGKSRGTFCMPNPTALAWNADGTMLAAGGSEGDVAIFFREHWVDGDDVEEEPVASVKLSGGIRALCFHTRDSQVQVATDFNSQVILDLDGEGRALTTGFTQEEGGVTRNLKVHCLDTSVKHGLVAVGGVGETVWLLNPETDLGIAIPVTDFNRIDKVSFVDERQELMVVGDAGVRVIPFSIDDDGRPQFNRLLVGADPKTMPIIGAHQYGSMLVVAHPVPAASSDDDE
jgi:hypothetical protein